MSGIGLENYLVAALTVVGGAISVNWQSGKITSVAYNGVGDYTLNLLDGGIDAADCAVVVNTRTAVLGAVATVVHTSDTAKQILLVTDAGAPGTAVDASFDITIVKRLRG